MPGKFSIFDGRDFQKGGMIMIRFSLTYWNIYWVLGWNRKTVTTIEVILRKNFRIESL